MRFTSYFTVVPTLSPTVVDLNQRTYQRLKSALELNLRRQIFIAVCDNIVLRDRLVADLEGDVSGNVSTRAPRNPGRWASYPQLVTLKLNLSQPDPITQISQWLRQFPPPVNRHNRALMPAFQIVGIEQLSRQSASMQWVFLNHLRSIEHSLPALESSLLLWVTRPWSRMIPQSAPNFWHCRTAIFDFIGEPTPFIAHPETLPMAPQSTTSAKAVPPKIVLPKASQPKTFNRSSANGNKASTTGDRPVPLLRISRDQIPQRNSLEKGRMGSDVDERNAEPISHSPTESQSSDETRADQSRVESESRQSPANASHINASHAIDSNNHEASSDAFQNNSELLAPDEQESDIQATLHELIDDDDLLDASLLDTLSDDADISALADSQDHATRDITDVTPVVDSDVDEDKAGDEADIDPILSQSTIPNVNIHQLDALLNELIDEEQLLDDITQPLVDLPEPDLDVQDSVPLPPTEEELAQALKELIGDEDNLLSEDALSDPWNDQLYDGTLEELVDSSLEVSQNPLSVPLVDDSDVTDNAHDTADMQMPPASEAAPVADTSNGYDVTEEPLPPTVEPTPISGADNASDVIDEGPTLPDAELDYLPDTNNANDITDEDLTPLGPDHASDIDNAYDATGVSTLPASESEDFLNTDNADEVTEVLTPPEAELDHVPDADDDYEITEVLTPSASDLDQAADADADSELRVFDAEPNFLNTALSSDPSLGFSITGQTAAQRSWLDESIAEAFQDDLVIDDPQAYALIQQLERLRQQQAPPNIIAGAYRGLGNLYRDRIEQGDVSPKNLLRAMKAYEYVIQIVHEDAPVWSEVLNDMGNLCWLLSRCAPSPEQGLPHLQQGIQAYRKALTKISPRTHPQTYPMIQNNLGAAYGDLARYHNPFDNLQQSVKAYQEALRYRSADIDPMRFASTQNNLGTTYWNLAQYRQPIHNLKQAISAYTKALQYYQPDKDALNYAMIQNNLGTAYWNLAQHEQSEEWLRSAIKAYTIALEYRTLEANPVAYAATQNNLGTAYWHISGYYSDETDKRLDFLRNAIQAYREALKAAEMVRQSNRPVALNFDVLATRNNLGLVQYQLVTDTEFETQDQSESNYLEQALDHHLVALRGWQGRPDLRQTAMKCVIQTLKTIYSQKGLMGQNLALSKIPGQLLPEILPQL